ncbi:MAG: hypothetical protein HY321_01865 [Armatimonadetes bacterium]|nr:hypothetical protein [Armatimonadota bacterium]
MRQQSASEFQRQNSRRLWVAVLFLIALLVVGLGLFAYVVAAFVTSGNPRALVTDLRQASECTQSHLKLTAEAADRYYRDKGEYPERIGDLHPMYLENRGALFCPADNDRAGKDTSFEYHRPEPGRTAGAVLACDHHAQMRLEVRMGKDSRPGFTRWEIRTVAKLARAVDG